MQSTTDKRPTIDSTIALVKRIKFLNWRFTTYKHADGYVIVDIIAPALDSYSSARVNVGSQIILFVQEDDINIRRIFHHIQQMLVHEASELFEFDGIKPFNQHQRNYDQAKSLIKAMLSTPHTRKIKCPSCGHVGVVKSA